MSKKLRYPTGVRPLLVIESARRRRVETRIVSILEAAGFDEVILPIIDYAEPYTATSAVDSRQTYRFVDRDGDLVAIRSDFTPMVARALAPSITPADFPLRVFYRGDVIRYAPSRLGANREMFQVGGEIIGDPSPKADIDALSLVSSMLRELGTKPLIVFSDAMIPERIAGDSGMASRVRDALAAKRVDDLSALRDVLPIGAVDLVGRLTAGTATTRELRAFPATRDVADRLDAIAAAIGADCTIHLDDVDRVRGYYTGLRFRAYDETSRSIVAQGGRYDDLYLRFGASAPAVGFTITIDDLD
jgi:ATP phosphoribosyltransferase regulatory subunit HisZ